MWVEAIVARDDISSLVAELIPLTIRLGDEPAGDHYIELGSPAESALVADRGLRVTCSAKINWPVLGIAVPIDVASLVVMVTPAIEGGETGDRLVFNLEIESADVSGVPSLIERPVVERINAELAKDHARPSWDFAKALGHVFQLPDRIEPVSDLDLQVAWGKVRVTDEAWVFAVSFHAHALRRHERPARVSRALATRPEAPRIRTDRERTPAALVLAGGLALASFAFFWGLGALLVSRR